MCYATPHSVHHAMPWRVALPSVSASAPPTGASFAPRGDGLGDGSSVAAYWNERRSLTGPSAASGLGSRREWTPRELKPEQPPALLPTGGLAARRLCPRVECAPPDVLPPSTVQVYVATSVDGSAFGLAYVRGGDVEYDLAAQHGIYRLIAQLAKQIPEGKINSTDALDR